MQYIITLNSVKQPLSLLNKRQNVKVTVRELDMKSYSNKDVNIIIIINKLVYIINDILAVKILRWEFQSKQTYHICEILNQQLKL